MNRPYLHLYTGSDELDEVMVIGLTGVKVESNPEMETLLGVRFFDYYPAAHILTTPI